MDRPRRYNGDRMSSDRNSFVDHDGLIFFHVAPHEAIEAGIRLAQQWKLDVLHLHTAWFAPVAYAIREKTGYPSCSQSTRSIMLNTRLASFPAGGKGRMR